MIYSIFITTIVENGKNNNINDGFLLAQNNAINNNSKRGIGKLHQIEDGGDNKPMKKCFMQLRKYLKMYCSFLCWLHYN